MHRKDLKYNDYRWQENGAEEPGTGARPEPGPFDDRAGEEVLSLINCFVARYGLERPEAIAKIEVMLHDYLPDEISCRREAFVWIRDHWSDYDRQEGQDKREGLKVICA